ncbi:MAG TPA: hypothetical protein VI197_14210, partial [Polyangiaceae bacterium]
MHRFPIRFDAWYRVLSSALLLRPSDCYFDLSDDEVAVRMGWAFNARFPRAAIDGATRFAKAPLSRG